MSTNWSDAVWNERGELVVSIYKQPPEMKDNLNNKPKHTYKEIDCGGECGGYNGPEKLPDIFAGLLCVVGRKH